MKIKVVADKIEHNIPIGTQLDVEYQGYNVMMVVWRGKDIFLFEDEYEEIE